MTKGDAVKYEAFGTRDLYDAEITSAHDGGRFFDIEVIIPGVKNRYPLSAVRAERLRPCVEQG